MLEERASGEGRSRPAPLSYAFAIAPRRLLAPPAQLIPREMAALLGQRLPGRFLPPEDVATAEALVQRFIGGKANAADRAAPVAPYDTVGSEVMHVAFCDAWELPCGTSQRTQLGAKSLAH